MLTSFFYYYYYYLRFHTFYFCFSVELKVVVDNARGEEKEDPFAWKKITIQSDKDIDFLTVKKVMYTVSEAGAGEINFAVIKKSDKDVPQ